jgi:hypothetical protein
MTVPAASSCELVEVSLATGTLRLAVDACERPLAELCGFAARNNRRRGFLFVSRVLGKHLPARPHRMREVCEALAAQMHDGPVPGPVLFIGMAETATGLGHGIYEGFTRATGQADTLFVHTTRYGLRRARVALEFQEPHSHAPSHIVYEPADPEHAFVFRNARTLVLVDDEITTGESLLGLAREYRRLNPGLESVRLAVLTDWLGPARRPEVLARLGAGSSIASLARGTWEFNPREDIDLPVPAAARENGGPKDEYLGLNHGRLGRRGGLDVERACAEAERTARRGERILVLGSSEFLYAPFKVAEHLETLGHDVVYQSTTRSPILLGNDIASRLEFVDNYFDDSPNFLYNVQPGQYDRVFMGYETVPLPAAHDLPMRLRATILPFS